MSLGEGVTRESQAEAEPEKDVEAKDEKPEVKKPKWLESYHDQPYCLDQMSRHPESVHMSRRYVRRFRMNSEPESMELDKLMASLEPEEAPTAIIELLEPKFSETVGDFIILVMYRKVMYKHPERHD